VCGPSDLHPADHNAITNPVLLIEVSSRSTERYDSAEKFDHYKTLPSLRQYVLVSHREPSLVVWTRKDDGTWQAATFREGGIAELPSIAAELDVRELYATAAQPSR
jgi:Uma2 family endonuclease